MESDHVQPDLEEGLLFQEFVDGVFATNEVPFRVNDGASYEYVSDTPYRVTNLGEWAIALHGMYESTLVFISNLK